MLPTTPVIDTLTRANENPLGSPWLGALQPALSEPQLELSSNQGKGTAAAGFSGSYTTLCGADCEAYMTVPTIDSGNRIEVYARIVDIHAVNGTDGYCVSVAGTAWTLRLVNNSSSSALGATVTQAFSNGDSLGIRAVASTFEAWYRPTGSPDWRILFTRQDGTFTTGGYLGARMFGTVYRFTNFGGGNVRSDIASQTLDFDYSR